MRSVDAADNGRRARSRRGRAVGVALALALATASCAGSNAPKPWLPDPRDVPSAVNGAWIEVAFARMTAGAGAKTSREEWLSEGEFLAVGAESVYVLTEDGVDAVPRAAVKSARVDFYRSQTGKGSLVTLGGTLSTASNGVGMIITGPLWILTGSLATGSVSREHLRDVPEHSWEEAAAYARFPQGLPADFDRSGLHFNRMLRFGQSPAAADSVSAARRARKGPQEGAPFTVSLVNGEVLSATRIEYSSREVVHFETSKGRRQLRARDVIRILDANGADVTATLLAPPR